MTVALSDREKEIVRSFASGSDTMRAAARQVYDHYFPLIGASTVEMRFLSEAFNTVPDLALRNRYRREILGRPPTITPLSAYPLESDGHTQPEGNLRTALTLVHQHVTGADPLSDNDLRFWMDIIAKHAVNTNWVVYVP